MKGRGIRPPTPKQIDLFLSGQTFPVKGVRSTFWFRRFWFSSPRGVFLSSGAYCSFFLREGGGREVEGKPLPPACLRKVFSRRKNRAGGGGQFPACLRCGGVACYAKKASRSRVLHRIDLFSPPPPCRKRPEYLRPLPDPNLTPLPPFGKTLKFHRNSPANPYFSSALLEGA